MVLVVCRVVVVIVAVDVFEVIVDSVSLSVFAVAIVLKKTTLSNSILTTRRLV